MATITVTKGQCLIDIAIQVYGSIAALFDLAKDNNLEVDDDIAPGQVLQVQDTLPATADPGMVDYYSRNQIVVNSGYIVAVTEILADNDNDAITTNNNEGITI